MSAGRRPARIDAHQHFWEVQRGDYGWLVPEIGRIFRDYRPDDLLAHLRTCGIDGTVLVQAAPTVAETEYLLSIAARTPFVFGVVGWVDFESPRALAQIDRLAADPKLVGIRPMIQDIADDDWMLRPRLRPVFQHLAARGLAFDALIFPRHLPRLLRLLDRHPELRCVVDHCAKPRIADGSFQPWATDIARIARETPAFCKISGLATEAGQGWTADMLRPYVEHVLEMFGPERCMWGSDWPVLENVATYEAWFEAAERLLAGLEAGARAALFGGNAARFYGLQTDRAQEAATSSDGSSG